MGKSDIETTDYFDDNRLFADLANGFLFGGKQVIHPEELVSEDTVQRFASSGKRKKTARDNVKKYFNDTLISIYVLEHQKKVDYHMVIRNMITEAMEYHRQWKEKQKLHRENKDLSEPDELLSGMRKDEKFVPVITIVVYYGEKKWDGATHLHELLDFSGREEMKPYVEDYRIHVFDYHDYDNFEMFQTELNQVFSFLKCSFNKKTLRELIANRQEEYYNISDEAFSLIRILTNSKELLKLDKYRNTGLGGNDMCKALEEIREEGREEGRAEGVLQTLENLVQKGLLAVKDAAAQANMSVEEFQNRMQKIR